MNRPSSSSFTDLVTCLVINLDSRPERWERTRRLCRIQGISPVRFAAHDAKSGVKRFPDSNLQLGARGLWSSFLGLLEADYDAEWLLILEDDIFPLPRFRHHVLSEIKNAESDLIAIRIGWLGPFSQRPHLNFKGYSMRFLRAAFSFLRTIMLRQPSPGLALGGTHAILVRRRELTLVAKLLMPVDIPLDDAFIRAEKLWPNRFRRTSKNRAWQWPDRSDIQINRPSKRSKESKVAISS